MTPIQDQDAIEQDNNTDNQSPIEQQQKPQNEMFAIIGKTALKTLYFCVAIFAMVFAFVCAAFPFFSGKLYYTIGLNERAFHLYEIDYLRTKDKLSDMEQLEKLNRLNTIAIAVFSNRQTKNLDAQYYAEKIVEYVDDYFNFSLSEEFSQTINQDNISRSTDWNQKIALANHRDYLISAQIRSYVYLQNNQKVSQESIVDIMHNYFWVQFGFRVANSTSDDDIFAVPNWAYGPYIENIFQTMGMTVPNATLPQPQDNIMVAEYQKALFSLFYTDNFTATYNQIDTTVAKAKTLIENNKQKINPSNPLHEQALFNCLVYQRWILSVSKNMYCVFAIMLSQGRESFMSVDEAQRLRDVRDKWASEIISNESKQNELLTIYQNYLAAKASL